MRAYTQDWYLEKREPLPPGFTEWLRAEIMPKYLYFGRNGKNISAWCSGCGKASNPDKAVNGRFGVCPECGGRVKMLDTEKTKELHTCDRQYVQYLQKCVDGRDPSGKAQYFWIVRTFEAAACIDYGERHSSIKIDELQMKILRNVPERAAFKTTDYSRSEDYCRYDTGWRYGSFAVSCGSNLDKSKQWLYPGNLESLFDGTEFEYSRLWEYAALYPCKAASIMELYRYYPQIEYLIKLKCFKAVSDLIKGFSYYTYDSNNVIKFLGLKSKSDFQFIKENDYGITEIRAYNFLKEHCEDTSDEIIQFVKSFVIWGLNYLLDIKKYMPIGAFYKYFAAQKKPNRVSGWNFYRDYLDYITVCKQLNYNIADTQIFKPKDFYAMHDRTHKLLEQMRNKKQWEKFKRASKAAKSRYGYIGKEYSVIAPDTPEQLKNEGKELNHCVGGYIDRVSRGACVIVFVRKNSEPQKSFVTVEVSPKDYRIVQARSKGNAAAPAGVSRFIKEWERKKLEPLRSKER
jgi:hypothetical protein